MNIPLRLERGRETPLQDQLFEQLRHLIIDGKLKPNTRIIATRFLAEQVGVSRTTVLLAYERLISEGYLKARPSVGTFIAAALPDPPSREVRRILIPDTPRQATIHPAVPLAGNHSAKDGSVDGVGFDFNPVHSDGSNLLPRKVWLAKVRSVFEREPDGLAKQQPVAGEPRLRTAVANYLAATRGIMASSEQVIIVAGPLQACNLVSQLFQRSGDRVVLESPGDEAVSTFFAARRAEVIHVPVDEQGLRTEDLPDGPVSLVYATPARQNPLGGTMPQSRRDELLAWARKAGAYLVEDDSDSDLRYHGTTHQPLAAVDPYGLVFHTGTFAKTLGAGLGVAYLVVPPEFVSAIVTLKAMTGDYCAWLEQMVVADLLENGEYQHHLRRVRKLYLERRDLLVRALSANFGGVRLIGADAGTQLTWMLPDRLPSAETVCEKASAHGVGLGRIREVETPSGLVQHYRERALILGFAAIASDALWDGIACLAGALGA
jgi:GntR family transcriptional regulator/MocR family aminotransferase